MSYSLLNLLPTLAAASAAVLAYTLAGWLVGLRHGAAARLGDFARPPQEHTGPEALSVSRPYKFRLAFAGYGLQAAGKEWLAFWASAGGLGLGAAGAAALLGLPPITWLGGPIAGYALVNGLVNARWNAACMALDKEIPLFLLNLSSLAQLNLDLLSALENACASLRPDGTLKPWIEQLARAYQSGGKAGLNALLEEAGRVSSALALLVVELGRLAETGGPGYSSSLQLLAENLSGILDGRLRAASKAAGARSTIGVILAALGGTILMAFSNPASAAMFRTPAAQAAMVGVLAWAAFGWSVIGDMIRDAVE